MSLDDKEYADAFVDAEIATTLPFQLRAMRKQRGWKQKDVADRFGNNQKTISDFENPNYAKYTLTSLKKLASVFDVALIVRFAPFSELVDWTTTISEDKMAVPERKKDSRLRQQRNKEKSDAETTARHGFGNVPTDPTVQSSVHTAQYRMRVEGSTKPGVVVRFKRDEAA